MELYTAHKQWAVRPDDERVASIDELYSQSRHYFESTRERSVMWSDLRVHDRDGDLNLSGKDGVPAQLTHWAFGQLCARVNAPASYMRELPATLAAQNINFGLKHRTEENGNGDTANLLFHLNGGLVVRALTSQKYQRIWNWEIAERLRELIPSGWVPATPDIRQMTDDASKETALYVSDHDMFAFLRNPNRIIEGSSDPNRPIYKGLIVSNSEVGANALNVIDFMYNEMCGNHIIWGASHVVEMKLRHVGSIREKFSTYAAVIREYADESVSDIEARIKRSKTIMIAQDKEGVLDAVFGKRNIGLSRKLINAGFDAVVEEEDGDARTPWGLVAGLTRHSQTIPYADERTNVDRFAARVLDAF